MDFEVIENNPKELIKTVNIKTTVKAIQTEDQMDYPVPVQPLDYLSVLKDIVNIVLAQRIDFYVEVLDPKVVDIDVEERTVFV